MKNFISLIFAGLIGGLIVHFASTSVNEVKSIEQTPVRSVSYTTPGFPFNFADAAEKATSVVVNIHAAESESTAWQRRQQDRQRNPFHDFFGQNDLFFGLPFGPQIKRGSGSGVIISEDGYIVTNNHVVGFADEIEVTLKDGRTFTGEIVGTDPSTDLAVVKIETTDLPTLEYADSDEARVGEWVLAIGNPFEYLTSTVTAGIISAKGRDINIIQDQKAIEEFIQTDAAINPGNSGGALVDANGKLLGINTAIASRTGSYSGYSFAIPVKLMQKVVDDIIKYGSYQRVNLGVYIHNIDEEYLNDLDLDSYDGVVITELVDGGPAQYAGLRVNDVILQVDERIIKNAEELAEIVAMARVGDTLEMKIFRDGKEKDISVRLKRGL